MPVHCRHAPCVSVQGFTAQRVATTLMSLSDMQHSLLHTEAAQPPSQTALDKATNRAVLQTEGWIK